MPRVPSLSALLLFFLLACGGGGASGSGGNGGGGGGGGYQPVTGMSVSPRDLTLTYGMKQVYAALPSGPEAFAYLNDVAWTTNGGSLSRNTGADTTWTAPDPGSGTSFWVKATSTVNASASATVTITLAGSGTPDQDTLDFVDPLASGQLAGYLFAAGTADPVDQTFQPSRAILGGVSLRIGVLNSQYGDDAAVLKLKDATGTVIATSSRSLALTQFLDANGRFEDRIVFFPFLDVAVTPEATYTLALEGSRHTFVWKCLVADRYPRGRGWCNGQALVGTGDFLFRTYGR